ncbi:hypothetical protein Calag_0931 [Caldisphaera lagunensis DSM 15908]|uniref:Uncharacterized protein n=1 Tax=Caldisphaera lagunensis (strain DSM 15908 / JCM 11604 / ANMR 0165 / IC-154) TaxID=1056495 RepID=L0AC16_CALLD|nr:hypothetical protein [Caldisphaera lagunensis]AFZ70662.1 hypothetical protein Calag_0931 [Caldisphaera lagunensis DSM 15908]
MDRSNKFILTISILISLSFISLAFLNVNELGPYIGLYALIYLVSYRIIAPRAKKNYIGIALLLLFISIALLEVLSLIGIPVPKV